MTPFRRDGHLSDLGIDHALDGMALAGTDAHLESCEACRRRMDAANAVALPPLPASVQAPQPTPVPANSPWRWALPVLAAAVALFVAIPLLSGEEDQTEGIRLKGSGVTLQVFRDEGSTSARLKSGDTIAPGDRLGFQIRHRAGHLMIVGIDAKSEPYLCYPQGNDGRSVAVAGSPKLHPLSEAIRMDDTPGSERIVAVHCEEAFDFDPMADALLDGVMPPDCHTSELLLNKAP